MAARASLAAALLLAALVASAVPTALASTATAEMTGPNPIRKVVNMLQSMQKKVQEEGDTADKLYDEFMCYCKNSGGDLASSIAVNQKKVKELPSAIESSAGRKKQLEEGVVTDQSNKEAAVKAIADEKAIRAKEVDLYSKDSDERKANINAITSAIDSLKKGQAGSFLQTSEAATLRAYLNSRSADSALLSFLSGTVADPDEATGLLAEMKHTFEQEQKQEDLTEESAIESFGKQVQLKKTEVKELTGAIEKKMTRTAGLAVETAELKNALEDAQGSLEKDTAFAANMDKACAEKTKIHMEEKDLRAKELVAISETIKMLNSDDALELFKKTLPSASSSFLQLQTTSASMRTQARYAIAQVRSKLRSPRLDFISLALAGKKIGMDKVIKMIDRLIRALDSEQRDDDRKKAYCSEELDTTEDNKKVLKIKIEDITAAKDSTEEGVATLKSEIAALKSGITNLDKEVAEATKNREEENKNFQELTASNTAAKDLIAMAMAKMKKFYEPSMVQETSDDAPPPPPATASAYKKNTAGGAGVIGMMREMLGEIDEDLTTARVEEKLAQKEYEELMKNSAEKRTTDSQSISDKESSLADLSTELETTVVESKAVNKELTATEQYLQGMHTECDWLVKYYPTRKEARTDELDSLAKAKQILGGMDPPALVQVGSSHARARKFLPRRSN